MKLAHLRHEKISHYCRLLARLHLGTLIRDRLFGQVSQLIIVRSVMKCEVFEVVGVLWHRGESHGSRHFIPGRVSDEGMQLLHPEVSQFQVMVDMCHLCHQLPCV